MRGERFGLVTKSFMKQAFQKPLLNEHGNAFLIQRHQSLVGSQSSATQLLASAPLCFMKELGPWHPSVTSKISLSKKHPAGTESDGC
jgi:hypothetical protein